MHSHTPTYPPTITLILIHLYMYTGLAGATCSNHAISTRKQHWWAIRGWQTLETTQAQVFNTARQPDWNHPRVSLLCPLSGDPATDIWLWGNHQGWQGHDRDMEDNDCTQAKNKETQVRLWRGVKTAPQTFATHLLPYYFQYYLITSSCGEGLGTRAVCVSRNSLVPRPDVSFGPRNKTIFA